MKGTPLRRRDFVRAVALGASATTVLPAAEPNKKPAHADPLTAEIDARMALVIARYGDKLDDEARAQVRQEVEAIVGRAEALRKFGLENGEGPFPVFRPYRGDE